MKRIAAICLVLALFISLVSCTDDKKAPAGLLLDNHIPVTAEHTFDTAAPAANPKPSVTPLAADADEALFERTPRDGYVLAPTMFGLTGVSPESAFVLRTPEKYDGEALPTMTIDGQPQPDIAREDENTFVVTPKIPLTSNSVYVFRLALGEKEVTWAFQTTVKFEIKSTLPQNQSTYVPVRTGIEIEFSLGETLDIADHFAIRPKTKGEFAHRGSTVIFIPESPLEYGQFYTVTVGSGIALPGTNEAIGSDCVFSFETEPDPAKSNSESWDSMIHFYSHYAEFPSFAAPEAQFWLGYDREKARPSIDMNVYRMDDRAEAIAAVNRLAGRPYWASISMLDRFVDTDSLTNVHSSHFAGNQEDPWAGDTFTLPDNLPPGFYVLDASIYGFAHSKNQMIIQITDLAVQVVADEGKALIWVNDMTTGLPAEGANIFDPTAQKSYTVPSHGIAVIERALSENEYFVIDAKDGKESVVFINSAGYQPFYRGWGWDGWGWWSPWAGSDANSRYWTALQLDRTLFLRSDTLSLWGFVQNRRSREDISHVTAVLTEQSWWRWDSSGRDTLHRQNIPVKGGAYSGEIRLPNLDPGSYELAVYHCDILLNSVYFTIMDYVKPPYKLTVSSDISAIFAGEEVKFAAKTEFFEGTPVPDLDISYSFWGWNLKTPEAGQKKTNLEGVLEIPATPTAELGTAENRVQGESSLQFYATATLPEIGDVYTSADVRVFINDIDVRPEASRTGKEAKLSVDVNTITLERINNKTAQHWGDYLDKPVEGQKISVEIVEIWWESIQTGQKYDHVTRQSVPWYRYERREGVLERFELATGKDGSAKKDFQVPDTDKRSYVARLTTKDKSGRTIMHDAYIGRDYSSFFEVAGEEYPFLYGAKAEGYDVGDAVELTVMRGTEPVTKGNFLFLVVQDGILSYHTGKNTLEFVFGAQHVPNAQVFAYHFNGHTYHTDGYMAQRLHYNTKDLVLNLDISASRDKYRPGETASLAITATDAAGNPKAANVNIALVDEALFALMDYTVDTHAMLYRIVGDGLKISMATHKTFTSDGISYAVEPESDSIRAYRASSLPAPATGSGGDTRIRERFEDTAVFASVCTDERGEAVFDFRLPDNITSWRITASALSEDLYAGNAISNLRVTQPMFLHYTLNGTFLVGDTPHIGVNIYGTGLSGGERARFEIWREEAPEDIRTATGAAFERVNIPLWEMAEEGLTSIVIRASVDGVYSDAVRHVYQVVKSHRLVDSAIFYEVAPGVAFETNPGGLTNITFADCGRGRFLGELLGLCNIWHSGARIEGFVARREATKLIQTHFPDVCLLGERGGDFDASRYQTESGGMAILPYSEADLQTTVMLIPFVADEVNLIKLKNYLWDICEYSSSENKILALYGLAMLKEPVLRDLENYAKLPDLSVRDAAYAGLGLAALGEAHTARILYDSHIAPHIVQIEPYYRVDAGAKRAEILDATSVAALLAAELGMPEALGLHDYAVKHRFDSPHRFNDDALLINIERLAFISQEIDNRRGEAASVTYTLFGEEVTRDLGHGGYFTLRIPAVNMGEFKLTSTTGEVGAVSVVRVPLEDLEDMAVENEIAVSRKFFKGGTDTASDTFEQGDLVRVQITVDYSEKDLSGSYVITDFLPAGLVLVANSARFGNSADIDGWWAYASTEGQKVTFYDFNGRFKREHTYYYYARVISPGTFRAEGTLVQSVGAKKYLSTGEDAVLKILP